MIYATPAIADKLGKSLIGTIPT